MPAIIVEVSSNGQGFNSSKINEIAFYSTSNILMGISNSSNMMKISSNGIDIGGNVTTGSLAIGGTSIGYEPLINLYLNGPGTVTNPAYSWIDDKDTGMYKIASDSIGFSTGGSNQCTINSNGVTVTGILSLSNTVVFNQDLESKIILYQSGLGTSNTNYNMGIESFKQYYNVPTSAIHDFRVNGESVISISDSGLYGTVTGTYGSIQVDASRTPNTHSGYSIDGKFVFMASNTVCGIYDDVANYWSIFTTRGAGTELRHAGSTKLTTTSAGITVTGTVTANTGVLTSDDRIKSDEVFVTDATVTLLKLRPQIYNKWDMMDYSNNSNASFMKESGLIAQEVFYDAPELRHIVHVPEDADLTTVYNLTQSSSNPAIDPDYPGWGTGTAGLNYVMLIPYLIKSIQEKDAEIVTLTSNYITLDSRLTAAGF